MTPTTTTAPPHATVDVEIPVKWSGGRKNHVIVDVALRALLFVTGLVAIIVMVTSKQSKMIRISPVMAIPLDANWNQSPAYIYYVAAHCVACLYSIITGASSVLALKKIGESSEKLQPYFVILDSLLLGIISSAVGAGAAVAYIGIKGNSHSRWNEICDMFGSFCHHVGVSIFMSLISTVTLLLLVWLSFYALTKKIMK
ncbi:hypothetical protein L1987_73863 [Smallanthus sonchifolius]|uniref:Uncharacterized protein n=1 Tax=Smallanthus sonchifolius TaxID=185202 RepID=A0ACB9A111_9ASTR|nr:hypothetical protein L1987_73863 [Smallanthus sonchifolius]